MTKQADLIIIGASGFAKEVKWVADRAGRQVTGFIDDNETLIGSHIQGLPVLGRLVDVDQFTDNTEFIIAIANPRIRKAVAEKLRGRVEFATLIDPAAQVGEDVSIAPGSVICAGAICTVAVSIGEHSIINKHCSVGHDVVMGDYVTLAPMVVVSGNVSIGCGVEVGASAAIRQGLNLGVGSMLGMGGILVKDLDANTLSFGNPARRVRELAAF